jgi:hypothetical protein
MSSVEVNPMRRKKDDEDECNATDDPNWRGNGDVANGNNSSDHSDWH